MKFCNFSNLNTNNFNLSLIKPISGKEPSPRKIKINFVKFMSNFFCHKGFKKTFLKNFTYWTKLVFNLLKKTNTNLYPNFLTLDEFKHNIQKDKKNININYIMEQMYLKSQVNFKMVCTRVDKRYKKKLKKKYLFKLNYIKNDSKIKLFFKNAFFIVNKSTDKKFKTKLEKFLNNTLFNFKNSEVFKIKLLTLKQLSIKNK